MALKNLPAVQESQVQCLGQEDPGAGHGSRLLYYSCLENPMDRGAWWAMVHRVAKSQTRLKQLNTNIFNGFPSGSEGKESACSVGDQGLILGSGRSPGKGPGNQHHYSCLEHPMDRGAWQATVHGGQVYNMT